MTSTRNIAIFLLLLLPVSTSLASRNSLNITPVFYLFDYKEFDETDQLLDKEHGLMPGLKFGFEHAEDEGTLETHIAFFGGAIDYSGQTQSGTPHQTTTDEQLLNIGIKLMPRKVPDIPFGLFFGFQHWQWDRNIRTKNNVLGLHEIYSWDEIEAGLRFDSETNLQALLWLEISALYIFNPSMEIVLDTSKHKLDLGERPGFRLRAGKTWKENQRTSYSFNLLVEYWSFERSNTIFVNDFFGYAAFITEPTSETINTGFEFTFSQEF